MAEQGFARRMMAQRLMTEKRDDPFSDSRFFVGKMRPSLDDMENPTRFSDMAMPAYSTAATGSLFAPGAGVTDIMGYAPDPAQPGEFLPSFGQNITRGNYLDAGLQTLGGAGDVMMAGGAIIPPLVGVGAALKAPRAVRVAGQAGDVAADVAKVDPNQQMGDALAAAQARYFETGSFEPPTAEDPVSVVLPTETEPGIIAFHGSGADFDEFRLEMIGTGEGSQAFGYGLYFTDSEDIARFYKESVGQERSQIQFKGKPLDSVYTVDVLDNFGSDIDDIVKRAEKAGIQGDEEEIRNMVETVFAQISQGLSNKQDAITAVESLGRTTDGSPTESMKIYQMFVEPFVKEPELPEGRMYKVALSPKPDELLDYDLDIARMPKEMRAKIEAAARRAIEMSRDPKINNVSNYDPDQQSTVGALLGDSGSRFSDLPVAGLLSDLEDMVGTRLSTKLLSDEGIPGLKYRAAGSRSPQISDAAAKRNYVIFDDKAVKILEKYGIIGPVLVTGGAVAATQRGGEEEGSIFPDA